VLQLTSTQRDTLIATCVRALPHEGCGLLIGTPDGVVAAVVPTTNVAESARVYEIDPREMLRATREASAEGHDIIGVFHSHTHSDAYPSPTDVRQAPDPEWHYVLVSFRLVPTVLRSYRIMNGEVREESIEVREG